MADDSSKNSGAAGESDYPRNLPAVIEPKRESWLGRTLRTWFGWRSTTLKPGDAVVMTIRPLRSGEHGGAFVSVKLPDGRVLTDKAPASPS